MKKFVLLFFMLLALAGTKAEVITPISTTPEDGANYSFSEYDGYVAFNFEFALTIDKAYIVPASGDPVQVTNTRESGALQYEFYCLIADQMKTLMNQGTIKVGETFQVKLTGIKNKQDPTISYEDVAISLIAPRVPATLVSIHPANQSTINSYYAAGDAGGLITYTFTEPVICDAAKIVYGDGEAGTYGEIPLPKPEASGSTIIANIQGIKLSPSQIQDQKSIGVQLLNVKMADGTQLEGNIQGTPGTYGVNYTIKSSTVAVSYIFTPDEGSNIDHLENISCYFSYPVTFEGVKLTYTLGGAQTSVVIPKANITVVDDPNDDEGAFEAFIPVKDLSFDAGAVEVEFIDALDTDGNSVEVKGSFVSAEKHAATTILFSVTPEAGTTLVPRPQQFVFTFSDLVTLDFFESVLLVNGEEVPLAKLANLDRNVVTINYAPMMSGDLIFKLRVKNAAGNYITYGDTEGYVTVSYTAPLDIFTCATINPAAGKVESLKTFTLTFNGTDDLVGGFDESKEIVLKNEAGEVVTKGTFDFPEDWDHPLDAILTLEQEVTADGIYLLTIPEQTVYNQNYDSEGALYNPEMTFAYTIGEVAPTTCTNVNPAPAQDMETLPTQFVFTFSRNITLGSASMANDASPKVGVDIREYTTVTDNVLTVTLPEGSTASDTFLRLILQVTDITGAYITYGEVTDYVVAEYTKKVVANTFICSNITPAEGVVTSLKEFTLTFVGANEYDQVGGFDPAKEIVLKDETGNTVTTGTVDFAADFSQMLDVVITLAQEVSEEGTYTLFIPEQTVYNGLYYDMADDFGVSLGAIYNPELTYTYTIQASSIGTVTAEELSGIVEVYSVQGVLLRRADASEALQGLAKGIYIVNGKKVAVK